MAAKTIDELISLCKRRGLYFNQMKYMEAFRAYMIMAFGVE